MKNMIKKTFAAIVTFAALVSLGDGAANCDPPYLSTRKSIPVKWCSLGTSITWYNDNVSSAFTKGYQSRVMEQIRFSGFANKGVNAGCISSAVGAVELADLYTIEHGVNDWGNRVAPGTFADYENNTQNNSFAANYRKVIDKIRTVNPNAKIVLCTPRKAYGFGSYLPATCDAQQPNGYYLADYVAIVNAIAEYEGLEVADFYTTCGTQSELASLSIDVALHPNDAGYQKMANELVKAILRIYPDAPDLEEPNKFNDGVYVFKTVPQNDSGCITKTARTLFRNVSMKDVAGFKTTIVSSFGANAAKYVNINEICEPTANKDGIYHYATAGNVSTFQIQWKDSGYLYAFEVELVQNGTDIDARVVQNHYYMGGGSWGLDASTFGAGGEFYDYDFKDENPNVIGMALKSIDLVVASRVTEIASETAAVPLNSDVLLFSDRSLEDVLAVGGDFYTLHVDDRKAGKSPELFPMDSLEEVSGKNGIYYYSNNGNTLVCQFQAKGHYGAYLTAVKLQLSQVGDDIYGRILWAKYPYSSPLGTDCDQNGLVSYACQYTTDLASWGGTMGASLQNVSIFISDTAAYGEERTVTFLGMNNAVVDVQTLTAGVPDAVAPTPPVVEGYVFDHWDGKYTGVLADITIRAVYHKLCTVTFYGKDGIDVIDTQIVQETHAATNPVPPSVTGWKFIGWDKDFSVISSNTVVTALYHQLFTVTFQDTDGTVLDVQSVEDGCAANDPDLSGYTGTTIIGWDIDFSVVTSNLLVTAVHGTVPACVTKVTQSGLLDGEDDYLIWGGAPNGTWDASTKNWYSAAGMPKVWSAGAKAVFPDTTTVTVSGAKSVAKIITLCDARNVTFSGDALTLVAPAAVEIMTNSVIRFNTELNGNAGYSQMFAPSCVNTLALSNGVVEVAGDYLVTGTLALTNGIFRTVGEMKLGAGGTMTDTILIHSGAEFHVASTSANKLQNFVNCTGAQYGTLYNKTTGKFIVEAGGWIECKNGGNENARRFGAPLIVYGTCRPTQGEYHAFYGNNSPIQVMDGGVMEFPTSLYSSYGVRSLNLYCNPGGTVKYLAVGAWGQYESQTTIDGGTVIYPADYSATLGADVAGPKLYLKNGATATGGMVTWGWNRNAPCNLYVQGTTPSVFNTDRIRMGQSGKTADSSTKMLENLDIADVTGDAGVDFTVNSEIFSHPTAKGTGANAKYFGIVKDGAGTVKFTGSSTNYNASLTMKAGTVAFGPTAKLNGTALNVEGNSFLEIVEGAEIVFADSADTVWTANKTVTIKGDLPTHGLRFGTDANGLTAVQLGQIKKEGSNAAAWLNSTGYLRVGTPFTIMMFK